MKRSLLGLVGLFSSVLSMACGTAGLVSPSDDGEGGDLGEPGEPGADVAPAAEAEGWSEPSPQGLAPIHQAPTWSPLPLRQPGALPGVHYEASCTDLLDDDTDGLLDCADPDCAESAACQLGTGGLGEACVESSDCAASSGYPLCLDEAYYGFVGGYCTELCQVGGDPCPGDGVCVGAGVGDWGACFDGCEVQSDCRAGHGCIALSDIDPTQASVSICYPAEVGGCANEVDDDGDGAVDCDDYDCFGDAACVETTCLGGAVAGVGVQEGSTWEEGVWALEGSCLTSSAWEVVLHFEAPSAGHFVAIVESDTAHGLYVLGACGDPEGELACSAAGAVVFEAMQAGDGFFLVVDAHSPADAGAFSLSIEGV